MKNFKNESTRERYIRAIAAVLFFIGAYFWVGGVAQIVLFVLSAVSALTASTGVCPLYTVLCKQKAQSLSATTSRLEKGIFLVVILAIVLGGSYYSAFFTKKFFLNDFNVVNNYYKQTLFYTGQDKREEAVANYKNFAAEYSVFQKKYTNYQPYALKADTAFVGDVQKVASIVSDLEAAVTTGDLKAAHLTLESIRPIFQDILKRNNISLLSVALVDFHDAMEKIIAAADAKDSAQLTAVYSEVDAKLKEVEVIVNDEEIQAIRTKLEAVLTAANENQLEELPAKAAELKSAFVKVYLKRG